MREMRLLAIDDLQMEDLNLPELPLIVDDSERLGFGIQSRAGIGGEVLVGSETQPALWRIAIPHNDIESRDRILAVLAGDLRDERRLLAFRKDLDETRVVTTARVTKVRERNSRHLEVEFQSADSAWTSEAVLRTSKIFPSGRERAMHVAVPGNTRTAPRIIITPLEQRSVTSLLAGWRYRKRATIVNLTTEPFIRFAVLVPIGNTAALVTAGKMAASGNDVRIWQDGLERERTLIGMNTTDTKIWVVLDYVRPNESAVLDVVYGNPFAIQPPVLTYPNAPVFTLASSSNASWSWPIDDVLANFGLGIWLLSSAKFGGFADFSVPGAWHRLATAPVPDNTDVHRAEESTYYNVVGVDDGHRATMDLWRAPQHYDNPSVPIVPNPYDSVGFSHPFGITNIAFSYRWQNINGRSQLVVLRRDSAAERWGEFTHDDSSPATLTLQSPFSWAFVGDYPRQIAMGIHPLNRVEIVKASYRDDYARALLDTSLVATFDAASGISITVGAEQEIYEIATELRLGGGPQLFPPYQSLVIGNGLGETGAGTRRCAVTLTQALVLDAERKRAEIYASLSDASWTPDQINPPPMTWLIGDEIPGVADGGVVATWPDESGSNNEAVQATVGQQPTLQTGELNGFAVVRFNGTSDDMTIAGINLPAVCSIFFVLKTPADAALGQRVYTTSSNSHLMALHSPDANDARMQQVAGTLDYANEGIPLSTWQIHANIYNTTASRGAVNGTAVTGSVGTAGITAANLFLGGSGAAAWADMDLAELVIVAGAVTTDEQARTEGYLAHKYGLESSLADGHPYQDQAPGNLQPYAFAEYVPARAVVALEGWDSGGVAGEGPVADWLSLSPVRTIVPNGTFDVGIQGWELGIIADGSDVVIGHDDTVGGETLGSLKMIVSADAGEINEVLGVWRFDTNKRQSVQVSAWRMTTHGDLIPRLRIKFYDSTDLLIDTATETGWSPEVLVPVRGIYVARVPDRASYARIGFITQSVTTGTHTVWWDDVTINDADIMVTDRNVGRIQVDVDVSGRWL